MTKVCVDARCKLKGKPQPIEAFNRNGNSSLRNECKACQSRRDRERRQSFESLFQRL